MNIEEAYFVVFAFREEEGHEFVTLADGGSLFDAHDQLLAYDIGNQMFLDRQDMIGLPEDADPVEKGEDELIDCAVDALGVDVSIEDVFEAGHVEVDHMADQFVDFFFYAGFFVNQGHDPLGHFAAGHFVDHRDFVSPFIEEGDIQEGFEFDVAVIADISLGSFGFQEMVSLFPYPDGMSLNSRQIFEISYGKEVHTSL
jgi:hypothetical protein